MNMEFNKHGILFEIWIFLHNRWKILLSTLRCHNNRLSEVSSWPNNVTEVTVTLGTAVCVESAQGCDNHLINKFSPYRRHQSISLQVPSAGDVGGAGGCSSLSLMEDTGGVEGDWSSWSLISSELSKLPDTPSGSPLSVWVVKHDFTNQSKYFYPCSFPILKVLNVSH